MSKETIGRILFLDNIRSFAIFMVICIHTFPYLPPIEGYVKEVIFNVIAIAVPVFFFSDGFLFSEIYSKRDFNFFEYVCKSLIRLIVPWLSFTFIYIVLRYFAEIYGIVSSKIVSNQSLKDIGFLVYGSVVANHLYFLLSMFFVRLCSFGLIYLALASRQVRFCFLICYLVIFRFFQPTLIDFFYIKGGWDPVMGSLLGLQYYFLGMSFQGYFKIIQKHASLIAIVMLSIAALVFSFSGINSVVSNFVFQLSYILGFITLILGLVRGGFLSSIGRRTMGIYLLHIPIVVKGLSIIFEKTCPGSLASYALIPVITLIISLGMTLFLERLPLGRIILGNAVVSHRE